MTPFYRMCTSRVCWSDMSWGASGFIIFPSGSVRQELVIPSLEDSWARLDRVERIHQVVLVSMTDVLRIFGRPTLTSC